MTSLTKALKGIHKQIRRYNRTNKNASEPPKHERHGNTSEWVSVGVNFVLAALTLVAIFFAYQANQTSQSALNYAIKKDSLNDIQQFKKDAIDSLERVANKGYIDSSLAIAKQNANAVTQGTEMARKSAIISEKSAEFYRMSTMEQTRAYVFMDTIEISSLEQNEPIACKLSFRNVGKTPASHVQVESFVFFREREEDVNTGFFNLPFEESTNEVIGADRIYTIPQKYYVPKESDYNLFLENKVFAFYMAKIAYTDIYGRKHRTNAFFYVKNGDTDVYSCSTFNNSD